MSLKIAVLLRYDGAHTAYFSRQYIMLVYPIYALTLRNAKENCSNVQMSITNC